MKRLLPVFLGITLLFLLAALFSNHKVKNASAAPATHVVISEVQLRSVADADDEFIELYNPTSSSVDMTGWRLTRKTSTGTESNLVASLSSIIPSHGYFLVARSTYTGSPAADQLYSNSSNAIANDNTITLYSDAGTTVVDLVGIGSPFQSETSPASTPSNGGSIERKANSASTEVTMGSGGADEFMGNSEDTDDNSSDFVSRTTSQPQNSASATEPVVGTPTPSQNPSATPSPTAQPSASPTPTESPSVTPTTEPSAAPSPTVEPSPTPIPSPTPTPGGKVIIQGPLFTCTLQFKSWRLFNKIFFFPFISCARTV